VKRGLLIAGMLFSLLSGTALAQTWTGPLTGIVDSNGNQIGVTNPLPTTATSFAPNGNYTTISTVNGVSTNTLLPGGAVVLISNIGSITAYVNVGPTNTVTATQNNILVPPLSTVAISVGLNQYIAAVTSTGTTTITLAGGAGLFAGFTGSSSGGGGGGGGGNTNLVQIAGNAVATGTGTPGAGSQQIVVASDPTTVAGSTPGAAGTPSAQVVSVQGAPSMTPVTVNGAVNAVISGTAAATQSGTWTVQPGNTPNTTAWLVTGTGGTFPATQSGTWNIGNITGSVSLPTGAATAANQTAAHGPVVAGTAATASVLNGGVFNSSAPTLATGQQVATQMDAAGNTKVNIAAGNVAATQSGAWNIANVTGTVSLPAGAATSANQTNASAKTQIADGSGNVIGATANALNVECQNCSGSGVSSVDEAAFLAGTSVFTGTGGFFQSTATNNPLVNGQQGMVQLTANRAEFVNLRGSAGAEEGTTSAPLQVTGANGSFPVTQATAANLNATVVGNVAATESGTWTVQPGNTANTTAWLVTGTGGTFPATESGTWNITNISGTISLPTGAATAANQAATHGTAAPGTAATASDLIGGVFNTSAPALTNGQQASIQMDSAGDVKVNIVAGTVAATQSGTWTNTVTQATASNLNATIVGAGAAGTPNSGVETVQGVSGMTPVQVSQATAANLNATVTGTVAATESGAWNITNITGTVSLPTGASTAANQTSTHGTVAAGTAATASDLGGGVFNTVAPTLTTGQQAAIQLDSSGNTKVTIAAGTIAATQSGTWNVTNISGTVSLPTGASTAANQTSVTGTVAPGTAATNSLLQGGVFNTAAPTLANGQQAALQMDSAGNAKVDVATVVTVAQGTAANLNATVTGTVAATESGTWTVQPGNTPNTTAWLVTGTGGTFPATESGTWNITNISGTISLPTGAATAQNQSFPLGSSTGGPQAAFSELGGGIYNTSAPTLTNTQQAGLQLDINGNLKVNTVNNATAGSATGGTAATSANLVGGVFNTAAPTLTNGQQASLQLDAGGNLSTTIAQGKDVTEGSQADAVCSTATSACSLIALTKYVAQTVGGPIPAGSNSIGTVTAVQGTPANLQVQNTPTATVPQVKGFGSLSATNSSVALSTLTTGPNSAGWPTSPGMVFVSNSSASAGLIYVCPLAGSCNTTGIQIAPGGAYGFYQPSTSMTVIAASTATVGAQW
jgi:hypothetical protein